MPENNIREKVRELILGLARTISMCAMYTEDHKLTQDAIDGLYKILSEVLSEKEEITIGVIGNEIAFEKEPYYEESERLRDFIDHLKEIKVKKISFGRGIGREELIEFNKILSMKGKDLGKIEGGMDAVFASSNIQNIAIGDIGFRKGGGGSGSGGGIGPAVAAAAAGAPPGNVAKENYEEGMEYLTKAFEQTKGHQPLNVQSARQIVSGMIENLLKNKNLLLVLTSIKGHDQDMFSHGVNTAVFTLLQAEALGLEEKHLNDIGMASLLHDVGKLSLSEEEAKKMEGKELTEEEKKKITEKDVQGAKTLLDTPGISVLAAIVAFEHNIPYDMSEGPKKVYGKGLNLVSMMIAISDHYDKLKRDPEYQKEGGPEKIYEHMLTLAGTKFHPDLLENFFSLVGIFPPGTLVELDTGEIALVIQPSMLDIRRPQIEILYDQSGKKYKEPRVVNLLEKDKKGKFKWTIIKSVSPLEKFEVPEKYS